MTRSGILRTITGFMPVLAAAIVLSAEAGFCATMPNPLKASPAPTPVQSRLSSATQAQIPAAIPLAQVAAQASDVANYLNTLNMEEVVPEITAAQEQFPALNAQIEREYAETMGAINDQATLEKLQSYSQVWSKRQLQLSRWLTMLTGSLSKLQANLSKLDLLHKSWKLTLQEAVGANAPAQFIQQIKGILAGIGSVQAPLKARVGAMLVSQELIAEGLDHCEKVLAAVNETQKKAVKGILVQDSPPLWSIELHTRAEAELPGLIQSHADRYREKIVQFISSPPKALLLQAGLFVVLVVLFIMMRRKVNSWHETGDVPSCFTIFQSPYAAAIVGAFYAASSPYSSYSHEVRALIQLLALPPTIHLVWSSLDKRLRPPVLAVGALFALDTVRQGIAGAPLLEQAFLLVEAVSGIAVLWWSLSNKAHRHATRDFGILPKIPALRVIGLLLITDLAASLAGAVFGYIRLARLLASSMLVGGVLALGIYITFLIANGTVLFLLRVVPLSSLRMVARHAHIMERRIFKLLVVAAILSWLARYLDYIGFLSPVISFMNSILATRIERGAFSISIADVAAFVLTFLLALLFSSFLRFTLNEDVFPRMRIAPGSSYAVSNLLRYTIIVCGILIGLGELGVTLDRVIILISAFGVGISFGMQNIVNNFISGLILLFERPVHVGDKIEFGSTIGEVREIGIRSSKVRTYTGADIIVPNSQLVTEQVINWTFSDRLRRIDLPFGVNYGAEPSKIIEMIERTARSNSRILPSKPCTCLFIGYGDSSINFELRAWTDQFDDWAAIRSELAVAVYNAVSASEFYFPFPQREVRMLRDPEPEPDARQAVPPPEGHIVPEKPPGRRRAD